jgi:hypothetical protein
LNFNSPEQIIERKGKQLRWQLVQLRSIAVATDHDKAV